MPDPINLETLELPPKDNQSSPTIPDFQPEPLADNFLKNVPDADRITVAKYVNEWDKNVNEQFRKRHEELKPYKDLGSVEDIQTALSWISAMNEDVVGFYHNLKDYLIDEGVLTVAEVTEIEKELDKEKESAPAGIPPEFLKEFQEMKAQLSEVSSFAQSKKEQEENDAIQSQLDDLYEKMHTDFGDFDEDVMTAWLAKGMTPKDAIEKWNTIVKGNTTQRKDPQAPRVFTGPNGAVPQEQGKMAFKNAAERKAFAVQQLIASHTGE